MTAPPWARRILALGTPLALAWAGWFALSAGPEHRDYASRVGDITSIPRPPGTSPGAPHVPVPGSDPSAEHAESASLLDRAVAATLWDELFPERAPLAETPPPAPPTIDLIAVIGEGESRYAVLHDRATNVYYNARVGEPLTRADLPPTPARNLLPLASPLIARLLALGDHHAVLDLAGREVRIEATP